jgi:glycosyltransferase
MKISIITVSYNSESTIRKTLDSVRKQTWNDIEHIIIDGKSGDKTLQIINDFPHISKVVSEVDDGIYDAMNKGISISTGDVIGFLNSDDWFYDTTIIANYVDIFRSVDTDAVYGDLCFIQNNQSHNIYRRWISCEYKIGSFMKGWVPPHPTFYCKKEIFERCGSFNSNLLFAADFDLMCRFFNDSSFNATYLPGIKVNMLLGGATTKNFKNIVKGNIEIYNSLKVNMRRPGISFFIWKIYNRLTQLISRGEANG